MSGSAIWYDSCGLPFTGYQYAATRPMPAWYPLPDQFYNADTELREKDARL